MDCFICQSDATRIDPAGDYQRLACPACGEYTISNTALEEMRKNGFKFNVEIARQWLNRYLGTGEIPRIDTATAMKLI